MIVQINILQVTTPTFCESIACLQPTEVAAGEQTIFIISEGKLYAAGIYKGALSLVLRGQVTNILVADWFANSRGSSWKLEDKLKLNYALSYEKFSST